MWRRAMRLIAHSFAERATGISPSQETSEGSVPSLSLMPAIHAALLATPSRWEQALALIASIQLQYQYSLSAEERYWILVLRAMTGNDAAAAPDHSEETRAQVHLSRAEWRAAAALVRQAPIQGFEGMYYACAEDSSYCAKMIGEMRWDESLRGLAPMLLASLVTEAGFLGWEIERRYLEKNLSSVRSSHRADFGLWGDRWLKGFRIFKLVLDDTRRDPDPQKKKLQKFLEKNRALWNDFNHPWASRLYCQAVDVLPVINCHRLLPLLSTDSGVDEVIRIFEVMRVNGTFHIDFSLSTLQQRLIGTIMERKLFDRVVTFSIVRSRELKDLFPYVFKAGLFAYFLRWRMISLNGEVLTSYDVPVFEGQTIVIDFRKMVTEGGAAMKIGVENDAEAEDEPDYKVLGILGPYFAEGCLNHPSFLPYFLPRECRYYEYITADTNHSPSLEVHRTMFDSSTATTKEMRERSIIRKAMKIRDSPVVGDWESVGQGYATPLVSYTALWMTERTFRHCWTGEKCILSYTNPLRSHIMPLLDDKRLLDSRDRVPGVTEEPGHSLDLTSPE